MSPPTPSAGLQRFRHIAIEGAIGVGKSSLARKLAAHLGADLLLEQAEENPFLARFYADNARYALQTQMFFLLQRERQLRELAQAQIFSRGVVSDFMFAKDDLFARMTLSDEDYARYAPLYRQAAAQLPAPDLVLWLQASPDTLLQRIAQRAIPMERRIDRPYLERLVDAYAGLFERFEVAPLLVVQTDAFNPLQRQADFDALLQCLATLQAGREFLGPADEWTPN